MKSCTESIKPLMNAKDIADSLKIHKQTLWRWSHLPDFPKPLKRGRVVRYDLDAIIAWLEAGD